MVWWRQSLIFWKKRKKILDQPFSFGESPFRVPLDTKDGLFFMFQSFDDAVGSRLSNQKSVSNPAAALMMGTVDDHIRPIELKQGRTGNIMDRMVLVSIFVFMVGCSGQVLDDRTAKIHIDHLKPAADAKDRFSGSDKGMEQGELGFVKKMDPVCENQDLARSTEPGLSHRRRGAAAGHRRRAVPKMGKG